MKRMDRAVLGEFLALFGTGVTLFSLSLLFVSILPSLQYVDEPLPGQLVRWILALVPTYLVQAVPIGVVLATLVSLGRLVRDREFLAMRAGGIGAARPVFLLVTVGALLAAGVLAAQQWWVPRSSVTVSKAWWRLVADRPATFRLEGGTWFVGSGNLSVGSIEGSELRDVRFDRSRGDLLDVVRATSASYDGRAIRFREAHLLQLDLAALDGPGPAEGRWERLVVRNDPGQDVTVGVHATLDQLVARYSNGSYEDGRSLTDLWRSARNERVSAEDRLDDWIRLNRKVVEALGNVAILMLAIPLALRYGAWPLAGFGLTLGTAIVWYLGLAGGEVVARAGLLPPGAVSWAMLGLFGLVGTWLVQRIRSA